MQAPLVLKFGDPIKLKALTAAGAERLRVEGDLWTVLRVEAVVLPLDLNPGILIAMDIKGTKARWLRFCDPDLYIEPCCN